MTQPRRLLGRLAARWFNEVIATDALGLLLDEEAARAAFLDYVSSVASVDLGPIRAFERERTTVDGRVDLEGVDPQGRPRLVIEVKFGHHMSTGQMSRYLAYQQERLAGVEHGVLMLLVPENRIAEARSIMGHVSSAAVDQGPDHPRIQPIALSWEACLDAIETAVAGQSPNADSLAADVVQLRAMSDALGGWTTPLTRLPDDERSAHLKVILEELKMRVPAKNFGPLIVRDPDYTTLRYFGVPGTHSYYSIGVTDTFREEHQSPVWLRFHRKTPGFSEIEKYLRRSEFSEQIRLVRGHIWLPLLVDDRLASPELVEQLAAQVARILSAIPPTPLHDELNGA